MTDSHEPRVDHQGLLRNALADSGRVDPRRPRAPEPEELAPFFPDHEILGLIGRGGMGAVYKAVQRRLDRIVAIKVLPRELAADPEFGERFLREAKALATLNHPHVLTVHDFGSIDGMCYLVTEFVDGVNLRQLMEIGQLSPAEALRITPQICSALQYAHEHGVVHRDVKPENILIDAKGQVKIADFGLAKLSAANDPIALTRSTAVFGTPHYMAPEQWRGSGTVDHRADIFSLGVVLYEMLTGQLPLGHYDPPSQQTGVPRGLDQVVQRSLAQRPENRYQSVREVQDDVEVEARGLGRSAASPPPPAIRTPPRRRTARLSMLPVVALILVVVALIGGVGVTFVAMRADQALAISDMARRSEAEAQAARVAEQIALGEQPTMPSPSADPRNGTRVVGPSVARGMLLVVGLAFVLFLASMLGFWSIRRIRASDGGLRGMGLAVFVAWLLPLAIADALVSIPIANIRNDDLQLVATFAAIVILGIANVAFLVWQTRRQCAIPVTGAARGTGAGLVVTLLILLGLGGCGTFVLYALVGHAVPQPSEQQIGLEPEQASRMMGFSVRQVFDRLGPPVSITVTSDELIWSYRDSRGRRIDDALSFANGTVVSYSGSAQILVPSEEPWSTPALGQAIGEVIEEYGPPTATARGLLSTDLSFRGNLRVTSREGIVVGVSRGD